MGAPPFHPAKVVTLLISDVPSNDPINIAPGPIVPAPTTLRMRSRS
jgi:glycerate 2-kinase